MDRIMFREFKGENAWLFPIKEKDDEVILKRRREKNIHLSIKTFKRLEELGEKIRFETNNRTRETLLVYVIPQTQFDFGSKLIKEEKGKMIFNIAECLDKKSVYEMIRREAEYG